MHGVNIKFIFLYVLISLLLDSKREDNGFWTERYEALPEFNPFFISSCMQICFVIDLPSTRNLPRFRSIYYLYI
jgi:hypothetical protein